MTKLFSTQNRNVILRLAALTGLGLSVSGCMTYGYGDDAYYGDSYAANQCDPYYDFDDYYGCDYGYGFVNIGFGGGWYNSYYYPGYGLYLYDNYGRRYPLRDSYSRYWAQQRYNWYRERHGRRGHDGRHGGGYGRGSNHGDGYGRNDGYDRDGRRGGGDGRRAGRDQRDNDGPGGRRDQRSNDDRFRENVFGRNPDANRDVRRDNRGAQTGQNAASGNDGFRRGRTSGDANTGGRRGNPANAVSVPNPARSAPPAAARRIPPPVARQSPPPAAQPAPQARPAPAAAPAPAARPAPRSTPASRPQPSRTEPRNRNVNPD